MSDALTMFILEGESPADLARVANDEHRLARDSFGTLLEHAVQAGDALIAAKQLQRRGAWLPWLAANFEGSQQTASNYMRLAKNYQRTGNLPDSSITKALAQIADGRVDDEAAAAADELRLLSDEETSMLDRVRSGETVVVNIRSHTGLVAAAKAEALFTRIDRRTDWGNPFEMPADGDRRTVIRNFARYYLPHKPSLQERLAELRGKALGCWCAPERCHGDVLREAVG